MTAFKLIFMFFLDLGKKKMFSLFFSHLRSLSSAFFPTTIYTVLSHCPEFQAKPNSAISCTTEMMRKR